jgi:glycerol-3-phosphate dehydrogenase
MKQKRNIIISSKLPMAQAIELGKAKIRSRVVINEAGCWARDINKRSRLGKPANEVKS